jgi:hypothetical protein
LLSSYSSIELTKLKEMLGIVKESAPQAMQILRGEHMGRQNPDLAFGDADAKGFVAVQSTGT